MDRDVTTHHDARIVRAGSGGQAPRFDPGQAAVHGLLGPAPRSPTSIGDIMRKATRGPGSLSASSSRCMPPTSRSKARTCGWLPISARRSRRRSRKAVTTRCVTETPNVLPAHPRDAGECLSSRTRRLSLRTSGPTEPGGAEGDTRVAPELFRSLAEVKGQAQFLLYLADQIEESLEQLGARPTLATAPSCARFSACTRASSRASIRDSATRSPRPARKCT